MGNGEKKVGGSLDVKLSLSSTRAGDILIRA
jgi:hypothetical protein